MMELTRPMELTDTELDAVSGGIGNVGLVNADVIVNVGPTNVDVDIRDVNVAVQALNNSPVINQV
jgi:hypothetical protein